VNYPSSKLEMTLKMHSVEMKTQQFKELTRDELFLLFVQRLESSTTHEEKGYGLK